jgi:hypothetical protein
MKELIATNCNHSIAISDDGEMTPVVEIIIVVSEPVYKLVDDKIERQRITETIRVSTCKEGLRGLIESLTGYADRIERMDKLFGKAAS